MNWYQWTIYLSFIGALSVALLPKRLEQHSRHVALTAAFGALVCSLFGLGRIEDPSQIYPIIKLNWIPSFGLQYFLGVDGISAVMVLLTGIASVAAILFSWNITYRPRLFFGFLLLLVAATYGVFLSFDLFLLFVFYELAIIPKYFLIAIWGSTRKEYGAMKLVLYSFIGSALVLFGTTVLYNLAKSHGISHPLDLVEIRHIEIETEHQKWLFILFFTGFGILAGLWPFHSWAPTGHVAAPTGASMLLAGVIMKLGAYGALRTAITFFPHAAFYWQPLLCFLASFAIAYAAGVALVQNDFKFVIGYSSVSHMGFVLLGLMALNHRGITGAVLQMFSHGLLAGVLFGVVGRMIYDRVHTRDFSKLQSLGLAMKMPQIAAIFGVAAIAAMGMPGFSGFIAELNVMLGTLKSVPWAIVPVIIGLMLGAAYLWRAYSLAFSKNAIAKAQPTEQLQRLSLPELLASMLLLGTSLVVGVYPTSLLAYIEPAVSRLTEGL